MSEADLVIGDPKAVPPRPPSAPTMRPVLGGFLLGLGLYAIDAINDNLARLFCILLIVAAFLEHGVTVFGRVNSFFAPKKGTK